MTVAAASTNWKDLETLYQGLSTTLTAPLDKKEQGSVQAALENMCKLVGESLIPAQGYLTALLPTVFGVLGHKLANKETKTLCEKFIKDLTSKMSPNAVREVLPVLFAAADSQMWQSQAAALNAIASFSSHAPEQLSASLCETIPEVCKYIKDLKEQVRTGASQAMVAACEVVGNRDIEHLTPDILRAVTNPEEIEDLVHKLAGVTFVQSVESPALAMVTPLLIKGLNSSKKATVRQSSVIINNMSKLVDEPIAAAPFMPFLMPVLEKAAQIMSDPEARGVCEKSLAQLRSLNEQVEIAKSCEQEVDLDKVIAAIVSKTKLDAKHILVRHIASLCCSLMTLHKFTSEAWKEIQDYLSIFDSIKDAASVVNALRIECEAMVKPLPPKEDDADAAAEDLCNCTFTLAYGTKILLHNTHMRLKRGAKYGLLGGNDSGKTTLMRAIANGSVEGFPDPSTVRTVFVEADILGELSHLSCIDYIMADERLKHLPREEVLSVMASVGFTEDGKAKPGHPVSSLSGGWRMKLAMARAMLQRADILLLDEPTNHLDVINVRWVKNYINSLTNVTAIMVSHDSGFLRDCCTHIIQIKSLKLKLFRGNLDTFVEHNPEAKSYFDIKSSKLTFTFPQPGPIEGIKSRSKALMKMTNCTFTYPSNTTPTLFDISIQVSMASRVSCVGENGAGKSTMIKLLTGEIVPQIGEVWKHPNARIAYVPQHAFHCIEQHMDKTPNEYFRWRYEFGEDKEFLVKNSMVVTEAEEKLRNNPYEYKDPVTTKVVKKIISELTGNRRKPKSGKDFEYEVRFRGESPTAEGTFLPLSPLVKLGWEKECKAIDARIAQTSSMYHRPLTAANVEKHLADVGLEAEFATHYRISALSGGQKVKVVMGAALWNQPHILILDEPTNYLDRESLGALAGAIETFQGGVVIISHHNEFVRTVCSEEWIMEAGRLTIKGNDTAAWMDRQEDKIDDQQVITTMVDAVGNVSEIKIKKKMTKREEKVYAKAIKDKIDGGQDLDTDEEDFAIANNIY